MGGGRVGGWRVHGVGGGRVGGWRVHGVGDGGVVEGFMGWVVVRWVHGVGGWWCG